MQVPEVGKGRAHSIIDSAPFRLSLFRFAPLTAVVRYFVLSGHTATFLPRHCFRTIDDSLSLVHSLLDLDPVILVQVFWLLSEIDSGSLLRRWKEGTPTLLCAVAFEGLVVLPS